METFRLGSQEQPWTQAQIDAFMDDLEAEVFDARPQNRGHSGGRITGITREDAAGNETRYEKNERGEWERVE